MVLVVKCVICQKKLIYTKGDPSPLVAHAKFDHPSLNCNSLNEKNIVEDKAAVPIIKGIFKLIHKGAQTDISGDKFINMSKLANKFFSIFIIQIIL